MNSDFWAAFVKQFLMAFFSSGAMAAYVNQNEAIALASGAGALVTLGYTLYAHYGLRKVDEKAVVTSIATTVADAKANSIGGK